MFRTFTSRDGARVVLRRLRWGDLDDLLELHNELIEEEAMIGGDQPMTREQQVDRHADLMKNVEKGQSVVVIAETEGKLVGMTNARNRGGRLRHTAGLGIFVKKGYRDRGIGSEMMRELETQAGKAGVEVLYLEVYSISPAVELYRRLGYTEYGRLPGGIKYRGEYVDAVSMYKRVAG
jgi:ribosomal protein S18 acetylase RimI-like enzyme